MIRQTSFDPGFSTVELLISLFIAAAFIGTGFQLFSVVTNDSNSARLRSVAASIADTKIQENMNAVGSVCAPAPSTINGSIPTADLPQGSFAVSFSCPYGPSSKTTRIRAVVSYGSPQEQIEGSLDVTR